MIRNGSFGVAHRHKAELHMITVEEIPRYPGSIDEVEGEIESADRRFAPVIAKSKAEAAAEGTGPALPRAPGTRRVDHRRVLSRALLRRAGRRLHGAFHALQPHHRQHDGSARGLGALQRAGRKVRSRSRVRRPSV